MVEETENPGLHANLPTALVLLLICAFSGCSDSSRDFNQPYTLIEDQKLSHPSDIIKFKGRYVVTELYKNRLVLFDDFKLNGFEYFDPVKINKRFHSPHFLAVTKQDTLLVSNGWGSRIVEISDLEGGDWKEFSGVDKKFQAPHGLCVDDDGWIYVGDSLNSRLVRFRDMTGRDWQVFQDVDRRVSYIRELVCRNGVVWASNSYEKRPGLNPGTGSNILRITDFQSGVAEIAFSVADTGMTGVLPLNDSHILFGLWGARNYLGVINMGNKQLTTYERMRLGTPYGMYFDYEADMVLVAYIGALTNPNETHLGGIAVYSGR